MAGRSADISGAYNAVAVTPSDVTIFAGTRYLHIGGAGAIAVRFVGGNTVTLAAMPVGIHALQVDKVLSTGTVATNIVALY